MIQTVNKVYKPIFTQHHRYVILMGGRGAGRSTVASQYAIAKLTSEEYFRCAIMRYILGDIRNSIYKEILDRAEEKGIKQALNVNESLMSIKFGLNSINAVGFKKSSGDQKAKLKSLANYNCVIIEEADEISEEDFIQLDDSLRTMKGDITVILLLNPPAREHWIIKRWFNLERTEVPDFYLPKLKPEMTDTLFLSTSYLDNRMNIDEATFDRYEGYRETKPDHYYNMIKGYVPEVVKGRIYSGWQEIDTVPHEARLERYGLDFGYSNDPTAIVAIYYYNGGYILDEICYQVGLSNKYIADIIKAEPFAPVRADSADPKSIDELNLYKVSIQPAQKGPGSVNQGIQYVQSQRISYTKRSVNIKKEYNNYAWDKDKDGNVLNVPIDRYNHILDATRYGFDGMMKVVDDFAKKKILVKRQQRQEGTRKNYGL